MGHRARSSDGNDLAFRIGWSAIPIARVTSSLIFFLNQSPMDQSLPIDAIPITNRVCPLGFVLFFLFFFALVCGNASNVGASVVRFSHIRHFLVQNGATSGFVLSSTQCTQLYSSFLFVVLPSFFPAFFTYNKFIHVSAVGILPSFTELYH